MPHLEAMPIELDLFFVFLPFWLGGIACFVVRHLLNRRNPDGFSPATVRFALRSQVVHRSYDAVEEQTGYPVPQALRDFYSAPGFLYIEQFEAPGLARGRNSEPTFILIEQFLPLCPQMQEELKLPDLTWLPFARDVDGCIYFLPLEEYRDGDGPVYQIDPGKSQRARECGNDIRRASDSLRSFLRQGARISALGRGGRLHE